MTDHFIIYNESPANFDELAGLLMLCAIYGRNREQEVIYPF